MSVRASCLCCALEEVPGKDPADYAIGALVAGLRQSIFLCLDHTIALEACLRGWDRERTEVAAQSAAEKLS